MEVDGGVKGGRDSSGGSPVDVAWALEYATSFDLCALPLGVSEAHPGYGGLGQAQQVLNYLHAR